MSAKSKIAKAFEAATITIVEMESRAFPQETHHIVYVTPGDMDRALTVASNFDGSDLLAASEFVIVRRASDSMLQSGSASDAEPVRNVHDSRCNDLIRLVSARSRVSNAQPSLEYVPDARANVAAMMAARHHLVFGRRGAGKTALLVEAKRRLDRDGAVTAWANIQTYRRETPQRVVLYVLSELLAAVQTRSGVSERSQIATSIASLSLRVESMLDAASTEKSDVDALIPRGQRVLRDYLATVGQPLYVFLDDFYYLARAHQPEVLDMLHGFVRDTDAWLKVASIKHLTRWWQASPPVGLQSGQDADLIDLDITLQDPAQAKSFLEGVLTAFARRAGIPSLSRVFRAEALDRLVIASGAVPRDYLVLASNAISRAQRRANAVLVGVQEVNQAAGDAATAKIQELEEDMASSAGGAEDTLATLQAVRHFCLEQESFTYFLVGFRDREENPTAYNFLTDLMDVRLIHLIDAGVSDAHEAGIRHEAFMLDLSQFSGARLKQKVRVLDFSAGHFVSRQTRTSTATRVARTTREFITILRAAPSLSLEWLATEVAARVSSD